MKKTVLVCIGAMLVLTACNTIAGVGQDVKGAGEWTADSAHKVKEKIEK